MTETRQALLGVLQVNSNGDTAIERAALNIPVAGSAVSLTLRFTFMIWFGAFFVALVPFAVTLMENGIFTGVDGFKAALEDKLGGGGPMAQVLGMFVSLVPFYTGMAVTAFRMASATMLSVGVIPLAVMIRAIKI